MTRSGSGHTAIVFTDPALDTMQRQPQRVDAHARVQHCDAQS